MSFSIVAYLNLPATFKSLGDFTTVEDGMVVVDSKWAPNTAGGSSNDLWSYFKNPQYLLEIAMNSNICILLVPENVEQHVNIRLFKRLPATPRQLRLCEALNSGTYCVGCACLTVDNLAPGEYILIPSSFKKGEIGNYKIKVILRGKKNHRLMPKTRLVPFPHPYVTLPVTDLFSKVFSARSCSLTSWFIIYSRKFTRVSLKLNVKVDDESQNVIPTMATYAFSPEMLTSRSCRMSKWIQMVEGLKLESHSFMTLFPAPRGMTLFKASDVEGGLSMNGNRSSAAFDYGCKFNSMTTSLMTLDASTGAVLVVTTLLPKRIAYPNCPKVFKISDQETITGSYEFIVISDNPVEVVQTNTG